jgi:RNA polymerase sigma-70 factor (ECF subfamily)
LRNPNEWKIVDNAELLKKIREDEPGAFEAFVDLFGDRIYGFGVRMCGEREDARDVAQDTLLQAYRSLKKLKHPEALRSWVFRVVSNACLMKRRKGNYQANREIALEDLMPGEGEDFSSAIPDPSPGADEELLLSETREKVRAAIDLLPPHYRMVLLLRDMEHFSTRETAETLDLPESTVKMRLHRARLLVRGELAGSAAGSGQP